MKRLSILSYDITNVIIDGNEIRFTEVTNYGNTQTDRVLLLNEQALFEVYMNLGRYAPDALKYLVEKKQELSLKFWDEQAKSVKPESEVKAADFFEFKSALAPEDFEWLVNEASKFQSEYNLLHTGLTDFAISDGTLLPGQIVLLNIEQTETRLAIVLSAPMGGLITVADGGKAENAFSLTNKTQFKVVPPERLPEKFVTALNEAYSKLCETADEDFSRVVERAAKLEALKAMTETFEKMKAEAMLVETEAQLEDFKKTYSGVKLTKDMRTEISETLSGVRNKFAAEKKLAKDIETMRQLTGGHYTDIQAEFESADAEARKASIEEARKSVAEAKAALKTDLKAYSTAGGDTTKEGLAKFSGLSAEERKAEIEKLVAAAAKAAAKTEPKTEPETEPETPVVNLNQKGKKGKANVAAAKNASPKA